MLIARIAQFSGVTVEEVCKRFLDGTLGGALSRRIIDALMEGVTNDNMETVNLTAEMGNEYKQKLNNLVDALEAYIGHRRPYVFGVVNILISMCEKKAAHVRASGQDPSSADEWNATAATLESAVKEEGD